VNDDVSRRGGAREGAGRPALRSELKRVPVQITLPPEYAEKLRSLAKLRLTTIGRLVENWLDGEKLPENRNYSGILNSGILDIPKRGDDGA
jgi:hypothetical protein